METWEGKCAKLRYSCTVPPSHASVEAQPAHCRKAGAVPGSVTGDQLLLIQPLMRRCVLSSHADVCVRSWSSSSSPPQQRGFGSAEHLGAHPGQRSCSLLFPIYFLNLVCGKQQQEEFKLFSGAERLRLLSTLMCILVSNPAALLSLSLVPMKRLCPDPILGVHAARGAQVFLNSRAPGLAEHPGASACQRSCSRLIPGSCTLHRNSW